MRLLKRLGQNERGSMLIPVGVGMLGFISASMLALDVGMFMVARSQAQGAADAGALAGATALVYDDYNDRSADGPAVRNAITAATAPSNAVMHAAASVEAADVTFPAIDRVKVEVRRSGARGNPLLPIIAPIIGIDEVDMRADATAQAAPANAMTCVKPFTIPDKWIERQTPPWDPDDTFDAFDKKGKPLDDPDIYIPAGQAGYTGYNAERDRGLRIVLKADNSVNIAPSFYYPYAIPGSGGADDYRWNIANCNTTVMGFGDLLPAEPGNMVGPTQQGMDELIARDPAAYWDTTANRVVSTQHPSPRVIAIPTFDPEFYDSGKRNGSNASIKAVNYIGFFIEEMQGNLVVGRITPVGGLLQGNGGGTTVDAFPKVIVLVE